MNYDDFDPNDDQMRVLKFKVLLLGDQKVGKSSICLQLCKNYFNNAYKETFGCEFFVKVTNIAFIL